MQESCRVSSAWPWSRGARLRLGTRPLLHRSNHWSQLTCGYKLWCRSTCSNINKTTCQKDNPPIHRPTKQHMTYTPTLLRDPPTHQTPYEIHPGKLSC